MPRRNRGPFGVGAPRAPQGSQLGAAQQYLGLMQNAQGKWVRPGEQLAEKGLTASSLNAGYTHQPNYPAMTPFANQQGNRMGFWDQAAGTFDIGGGGMNRGPGGAAPGNIAGGGHPQPFRTQVGGNRNGQIGGGGGGYPNRNLGRPNQGGGGPRPVNSPEGPGMPGYGGQPYPSPGAQGGQYPGFPITPPRPPNFLPMTPQFEAAQRGANDQYSAQMMNLSNQQGMIDPALQLQLSRMGTDVGYANSGLQESLANRGMYESGAYPYMYQRDIGIPYGRSAQDMMLGAAGQYADIAGQMGGAGLGYNQQMMDALLGRAQQISERPPMASPQFGYRPPRQNVRPVASRGKTSSRRTKSKGGKGGKKK